MATSIKKIGRMLQEADLKYHANPEKDLVITGFSTSQYIDSDGDHSMFIIIKLQANGEYLEVMAPFCYSYKAGLNKAAVFETLLQVSWKSKLIAFEYDSSDGEIRAVSKVALEDSLLSQKQLLHLVFGIVGIIDRYDPVIRKAIADGEIDFSIANA